MSGYVSVLREIESRPGRCPFCDDLLPFSRTKPRVKCDKRECMAAYQRAWSAQNDPPSQGLRRVDHCFGSPGDWKQLLECGHVVAANTTILRTRKRRSCPTCKAADANDDAAYLAEFKQWAEKKP